ncbi:YHYH domain-containing protein [Lacrimispora sp.]|uniref:YHYH domain-containing protein n=1 Tax=Lacrimispora sp. TaxID=2719234 RepID=UPI0039953C90
MEKKVTNKKQKGGTKRIKKVIMLLAAILTIGYADARYADGIIIAQAHSGRTDSQGGHHDYKNKSGLGSYHYHHGYPAHLHPNGVCPYENANASSTANQNSSSAPVQKTQPALNAADYKLVFDSAYYYNNHADLQAAIGNNEQKLLEHFVSSGMAEGRKGCSTFDVMKYKDNNPDLAAAYGDDLKKYYEHYMSSGYNENRIHN